MNQKSLRPLLFLMMIMVIMLLFSDQLFKSSDDEKEYVVSFSTFQRLLDNRQIAEVTIRKLNFNDYNLRGKLVSPTDIETADNEPVKNATRFVLALPYSNIDDKLIADWTALGLKVDFVKEDDVSWSRTLIGLLPLILIIAIGVLLMRRMQGGGAGGIFSFGKSRARLFAKGMVKATFADVAGCDEAKEEVKEIVDFLREPGKFTAVGAKIPRGVLLVGPPGTGKTLLARAIAGEASVPFFFVSGSDFVEMFVGVGASRVRNMFEEAAKSAPAVIFVDELDAIGRRRGAGFGVGHDEREQTLNQILVAMDGFSTNQAVIVIAATNRPDILDPALIRPGRFDRQVVVGRPDLNGREAILKIHAKNIPLEEGIDLRVIARGTPGFVGADLANLVNEAALLAGRKGKPKVDKTDFAEARDKVTMGVAQKKLMSEKEKKIVSYHEAGHTIVAKALPNTDPVDKVTIVPRGLSLGATHSLPEEDRLLHSKDYLLDGIAVLMGGRVAEEILGVGITNGASNDIERATGLVRKMVCEWGMSELGLVALGNSNREIFLGRDFGEVRNYSEETAREIDEEIKRIVNERYELAKKVLQKNEDVLQSLAEALLEKETLDGAEIDGIVGDIRNS